MSGDRRAEALAQGAAGRHPVRRIPLSHLRPGMVLAEAMFTPAGVLLAAAGYQITKLFVAHLENFRAGMVREPIAVFADGGR